MHKHIDPSYLFIQENESHYWVIPINNLIVFSECQGNILKDLLMPTELLFKKIQPGINHLWRIDPDSHMDRLKAADLSYPVLMYQNHVIDGGHRIVKAYLLGVKELPTRHLKTLPEPEPRIK